MMPRGPRSDLTPLISVSLAQESDIVTARQRARQIAAALGLGGEDQVRVATAVSEIARNAFQYAGGGRVDFLVNLHSDPQRLTMQVLDNGPGIKDLDAILEGRYKSRTGMGIGLSGTRRLMDSLTLEQPPGGGTLVRFDKSFPPHRRISVQHIVSLSMGLLQNSPRSSQDELRQQNTELLETLQTLRNRETELEQRQAELARLNLELEETNRGVMALYAELDENAVALRRADELKSRFLSHVSHEFRTPLNSILGLSDLLLRRVDGDLTSEQVKQVGYVRRSAQELIDMVDDLLDLAKVEAGKTEINLSSIEVGQLFGALRAIMRPLATNDAVTLVFEEPARDLTLVSDEGKVSQILRNLISNALKFTDRGEVRVSAGMSEDGLTALMRVSDTGIGIAPEDQERVFQEFAQIQNRLQKRVKGTGLGLPLSRKLSTLLGGRLEVTSSLGEGSTFTFSLPVASVHAQGPKDEESDAPSVLIIDDEESARYLVAQLFRGTKYRVIEAAGGVEGAERARFERPALVILDLVMPDRSGFQVLEELKSDARTRDIPVVIHTSKRLNPEDQRRLGSGYAALFAKSPEGRRESLHRIREILKDESLFARELDETRTRPGIAP